MPYTLPLRDLPSLLAAQGQFTDAQGRPTREFFTYLSDLQAWLETAESAFGETGQSVLTVATLPAAAGRTGVRYMVSDANATTFNSTVAAGGANIVPVFSNGTNWKIG
jgi:hypothetical protein